MKLRIIIISVAAAATLALTGCGSADSPPAASPSSASASTPGGHTTYPLTLTNCGTDVTYPAAPSRAVTLNQSAAEILVKLGVTPRIAGTGYEIDTVPTELEKDYSSIPQLSGPGQNITHEGLLGAQPDFVYSSFASFFTAENTGERAELHRLGVPTYLTEFDCTFHSKVAGASFDMLFNEYRDLAKIFDVQPAGDALIAEQKAVVDAGVATSKKLTSSPRVMWFYSTYDGAPYAAGPGGLPQHITDILGATNVFADASTKWPEVSWDEVAARNPDVIILADLTRGKPGDTAAEKIDLLKNDPVTAKLDAVKNDRFIVVPGRYMDPSYASVQAVPAVADGLLALQER
ncbi:ABC transporter substrate-binding protein [Mycetocola tolaasinivorans]|uniref:ABC transporter substrate-binding protein n=1 Tax=Mycetocola tolaasinivorans TaxID=76635 RepID=A0A3L7A123_9MICO|nr:ABC transporter substrate-binding protein [Mycetocola tolaasinivorans]RLP73708.1 ABC transporter substrate-binding protein [Mycetocola tolaasinivorans]